MYRLSLILSIYSWFVIEFQIYRYKISFLPLHDVPFPEYPSVQVQLNDPTVLLQKALESQLWYPVVHSLTSETEVKRYALHISMHFNWMIAAY